MLYLYGDYNSQPARAIWSLATHESDKLGNWERVDVNLSKLEQRKPAYKSINPLGKVPALKETFADGSPEFNLFESHAMMKYLCFSRSLP